MQSPELERGPGGVDVVEHDDSYETRLARRPRIVLAEDDIDVQAALCDFLALSGYEVVACNNGADMLDALAEVAGGNAADIIITDVRMPGMNGLSIAEELRADGWKQPIIVISAFGDEVIRERISRLDQCEFFSKPLDPERLEGLLLELCGAP
jgi:CheY-like chemotaxis protein